jgi:hypothetical protein
MDTKEIIFGPKPQPAKDFHAKVSANFSLADSLANLIIRLSPLWKCGVIVDARGARVLTKKDCDLPKGTVLVIAPDGTESKLHPAGGTRGQIIN